MQLDEALQSLGGSSGMVLTLDATNSMNAPINGKEVTVPVPRLALIFKVKDDRVFNQIDKTMAANPFVMRVDEPDLRMRTFAVALLPQFTARATAAMWNGYLILASDDQLVRDLVATQKEGKGLKATPEFAKLAAGLPEEGDGFQFVSQRFADVANRVRSETMTSHPGSHRVAMIHKLMGDQKAAASYTVSAHLENGWLSIGNGSMSGPQIVQQILMTPAAVATGMAGHARVKVVPAP
jgi:hypothetical protein